MLQYYCKLFSNFTHILKGEMKKMNKKMMSQKIVTSLLAVTCILTIGGSIFATKAAAGKNQDEGFSVEANYFNPSLTFAVKSSSIAFNGGSVDFKNDLGMTDKSFMDYRIHFGDGFRVSYMNIGYAGNGTLSQSLTYQGNTYNANANVTSNLDLKYARVTFIKPITHFFGMTTKLLLDLKGFDISAQVTGIDSTTHTIQTGQRKFRGAIPTVGFAVDNQLGDNVKIYTEVTGLPLGKYGHFYDGEIGVKYEAPNNISVAAGYRSFDLNVKDPSNGDHVQFKMAGPFANAEYKF